MAGRDGMAAAAQASDGHLLTMARSRPEATLALQLRALAPTHGWHWIEQYRWHPERRYRADIALWPASDPERASLPLLIEIDGASRHTPLGAHQRASGVDADCRRSTQAILLGYRVLRVSAPMVYDGTAIAALESLLTPTD